MDVRYGKILGSLRRSRFRSKFRLTEKDRVYVMEKGIPAIRRHAIEILNSRIAPRFPKNDGRQTPMRGHPVFVARRA
jgi:hypothetical protein